jgi:hypothetical protein
VKQLKVNSPHFPADQRGPQVKRQYCALSQSRRSKMKKILLASASAIALFGLAACSDTDETTTQGIDRPVEQTQPMQPATPEAAPSADETPGNGTSADEIRPVE